MGLNNWASLVTDPYERVARLYPALLAVLPLLIVALLTATFGKPLVSQLLTLLGTCGIAYLISNGARMLGKAHEARLFESWGGTPTTQLLRHSNSKIDRHSKLRYHAFLERKLKTTFPTPEGERTSPEAADETYRAGVKWLLGKTRDKKRFGLLFKENVSYGFHRNCYGLRWIGCTSSMAAALWLLGSYHALTSVSSLNLTAGQIAVLGMVASITIIWLGYFTQARVKQAAFTYADMLLRTCDELK